MIKDRDQKLHQLQSSLTDSKQQQALTQKELQNMKDQYSQQTLKDQEKFNKQKIEQGAESNQQKKELA